MQILAKDFLPIAEKAGAICTFDIESTGTKGDYNSILCISVKPWHGRPVSFVVERPGEDRSVVTAARDELEKYTVWISYYGKGFDVPMMQARLLRYNATPLEKRHHIDMYYVLKARILTGRRSQAHLLEWLETKQRKMTIGADMWVKILKHPARYMPTMRARCESDCAGLESLYDRSKRLIAEVTR